MKSLNSDYKPLKHIKNILNKKGMGKLILGVEEAGRGPVLGPMIITGVLIEENETDKLIEIGVKDSKLLSPKKRKELFPQIKEISKNIIIKIIEPHEIDNRFENKLNLNELEGVVMAEIIKESRPDKAIIDCPSVNTKTFTQFIKNKTQLDNIEYVVEHKADYNYPVVSAASIISKVVRDEKILELEQELGIKLGSGYPSDPHTKKFLEKNSKHLPNLPYVRNSWATVTNLLKKQKTMKDWV